MNSGVIILSLAILVVSICGQFTKPYPNTWGGLVIKKGSGDYNVTEKLQYVRRGDVETQIYHDTGVTILSFAGNETQYTYSSIQCTCDKRPFLFSSSIELKKTEKTCKSTAGSIGTLWEGIYSEPDFVSVEQACMASDGLPYYALQAIRSPETSFSIFLPVFNPTLNPPDNTKKYERLPQICYNTKCGKPVPQGLQIPRSFNATYQLQTVRILC
eukprot:TRINITY_DN1716_c0_g1_i1.p1 TRINITY_DN1716_c0_g1~~TRINITY_DN1716_c0_g1_i1.p1  ORF type:complete len:214 (+),score=53.31 TRINITY_DN1716_c0_g1_i1:65-706(+)